MIRAVSQKERISGGYTFAIFEAELTEKDVMGTVTYKDMLSDNESDFVFCERVSKRGRTYCNLYRKHDFVVTGYTLLQRKEWLNGKSGRLKKND